MNCIIINIYNNNIIIIFTQRYRTYFHDPGSNVAPETRCIIASKK
jgi:hypothetical protein